MAERPEPVSRTATRVIRASRLLTDLEKAVWQETWHLDGGPEGCYCRPRRFARRLGRSTDSLKRARKELCRLDLMVHHNRSGELTDSWFAKLYPECFPKSVNGIRDDEIFMLADRLDWLLAAKGRTRNVGGDRRKPVATLPPGEAVSQGAPVPPAPTTKQGATMPPGQTAKPGAASSLPGPTPVAQLLDQGGTGASAPSLVRRERSDFSTNKDGGEQAREARTDQERTLLERWKEAKRRQGAA